MADLDEVTRVAERDLPARDLKGLEEAIALIVDSLDPDERVLGAATGDWFSRKRCLAIATSRKLAVADASRLEQFPYRSMTDVEFSESWRKGRLVVRAHGSIADIRGIHLDRARSLHSLIHTARLNVVAR